MDTYPKRPSHFAHKFCRILMRCCVAQDIGPDAAYMLTQIVHTEDAAHYRRAVRFFNDQLVAACGFANVKALQRARDRAVASGWLHYEEGARSRPAIYWATIPEWAAEVDSGPMDEGKEGRTRKIEDSCLVENDQETVLNASTIRPQSVHNVSTVCPTIYPSPSPSPSPDTHTHTRDPDKPQTLRTWQTPPGCSEALAAAIDRWQAWRLSVDGRPTDGIRLETMLTTARSAGWTDAKIVKSIEFSIAKDGKSWLDPELDFQKQRRSTSNGKPAPAKLGPVPPPREKDRSVQP